MKEVDFPQLFNKINSYYSNLFKMVKLIPIEFGTRHRDTRMSFNATAILLYWLSQKSQTYDAFGI